MKILIGVDDSPHSRAAVEFVRRMAWPRDSTIEVLSVVPPMIAMYAEAHIPAPTYPTADNEEAIRFHQETAAGAERTLQANGLGTTAKVLHGDPRTELVETAAREKADLLVVGSHGRTGIAKLLMGSVASYVVAHAPCSVMVVKLADASGTKSTPAGSKG